MQTSLLVAALSIMILRVQVQPGIIGAHDLLQPALPSEQNLITRARLIAHTTRWIVGLDGYPGYVWLDRNTLLAFEGTLPRPSDDFTRWLYAYDYSQVNAEEAAISKPLIRALKVNARTGQAQPFTAFNTRCTDPTIRLEDFQASPNGKWLAFCRRFRVPMFRDVPKPWVVARLDGRSWVEEAVEMANVYTYQADPLFPSQGNPCWTRDSRHWVLFGWADGHMQCRVFSLSASDPPRKVAFPTWPVPPFPTKINPLIYIYLVGVRSDGRLLARLDVIPQEGRPAVSPPIEFVDFGLERTAPPPHHFMVTPPRTKDVLEVVLSPDGKNLAWLVVGEDLTHVKPLDSSKDKDGRTTREIWVSQADGIGMKRLGWLLTAPGYNDVYADSLRWTPDSKHLSFIYENALYTVPVH
jgi:hypothetical protein